MAGTTYLLLLLSLTATATATSRSFGCASPGHRVCWKNNGTWENRGVACKSPTEPCRGECPRDNPFLSEDGKSCSKCDGDVCPECLKSKDEWYCRAKKKCQKLSLPCDGECGPMRGYYPQRLHYCPETELCQSQFHPCGGKCRKKLTYCSHMKKLFYEKTFSKVR